MTTEVRVRLLFVNLDDHRGESGYYLLIWMTTEVRVRLLFVNLDDQKGTRITKYGSFEIVTCNHAIPSVGKMHKTLVI